MTAMIPAGVPHLNWSLKLWGLQVLLEWVG
jgi:hypothetical protein